MQSKSGYKKYFVPIAAYLPAAFTHTLQDNLVGPMLLFGLVAGIGCLAGLDIQKFQEMQADPAAAIRSVAHYAATASALEIIAINIVVIPLIIYGLLKSGN